MKGRLTEEAYPSVGGESCPTRSVSSLNLSSGLTKLGEGIVGIILSINIFDQYLFTITCSFPCSYIADLSGSKLVIELSNLSLVLM